MHTHQGITSLILVIALMATAEAGTKKAPPKAPQEPIDQMLAEIRKGDPKGLIVAGLRFYPGIPLGNATDDLQIIVTNQFHKAHYQERYQLTQLWAVAWNQINRDGRYSRVFVTDRLGNLVGRGTPHLTWVQER